MYICKKIKVFLVILMCVSTIRSTEAPRKRASDILVIPVLDVNKGAKLGDLYDAINEIFIPSNIFLNKLPEHLIERHDLNSTIIEVSSKSSDVASIDDAYSIKGSVTLSILSGLIELGGGVEFSREHAAKVEEGESEATVKAKSYALKVDLCNKQTMLHVNVDKLKKGLRGSHVLIRIDFGTSLKTWFKNFETRVNDEIDIKGNFRMASEKLAGLFAGSAEGDGKYKTARDRNVSKNFDFFLNGEIMGIHVLPNTQKEAEEFMDKLHEHINKHGLPQTYILLSLEFLKDECFPELRIQEHNKFFGFDRAVELDLIKLLEDVNNYARNLTKSVKEIEKNKMCISPTKLQLLNDKVDSFQRKSRKVQQKVKKTVTGARSGKLEDLDILVDYDKAFAEADLSKQRKEDENVLSKFSQSLKSLDELKTQNISCFPGATSTSSVVQKFPYDHVLIFYGLPEFFDTKFNDDQLSKWLSNIKVLKESVLERGMKGFFCDCFLNPEQCRSNAMNNPIIYYYHNTSLLTSNFYEYNKTNVDFKLWDTCRLKVERMTHNQAVIANLDFMERSKSTEYNFDDLYSRPFVVLSTCEKRLVSILPTLPDYDYRESCIGSNLTTNDTHYVGNYRTTGLPWDNKNECFDVGPFTADIKYRGCIRVYTEPHCTYNSIIHNTRFEQSLYAPYNVKYTKIKSISRCYDNDLTQLYTRKGNTEMAQETIKKPWLTTFWALPVIGYEIGKNDRVQYLRADVNVFNIKQSITNFDTRIVPTVNVQKQYIDGTFFTHIIGFTSQKYPISLSFRQTFNNYKYQNEIENRIAYHLLTNVTLQTAYVNLYVDYKTDNDTIPSSLTYVIEFGRKKTVKFFASNEK